MSPYISIKLHELRPKMSISTNVLIYQSKILETFNDVVQLYFLFTDFPKSFDKVNHKLLVNKLVSFGIPGKCLKWIVLFNFSLTGSKGVL